MTATNLSYRTASTAQAALDASAEQVRTAWAQYDELVRNPRQGRGAAAARVRCAQLQAGLDALQAEVERLRAAERAALALKVRPAGDVSPASNVLFVLAALANESLSSAELFKFVGVRRDAVGWSYRTPVCTRVGRAVEVLTANSEAEMRERLETWAIAVLREVYPRLGWAREMDEP